MELPKIGTRLIVVSNEGRWLPKGEVVIFDGTSYSGNWMIITPDGRRSGGWLPGRFKVCPANTCDTCKQRYRCWTT